MNKQHVFLGVVIACLAGFLCGPSYSQAQETERIELETRLRGNGWQVVLGRSFMGNTEYTLFLRRKAEAASFNAPDPILTQFFDWQQTQTQLGQIVQQYPEFSKQRLDQLLVLAFNSNDQILREGNLEISAGLLSYQVSQVINYNNQQTFPCEERLSNGQLIPKTCVMGDQAIYQPTELVTYYLPYWRVRYNRAGQVFDPDPNLSTGSEGLYFKNISGRTVMIALAYYEPRGNQWVSRGWVEAQPGEIRRGYVGNLFNPHYAYFVKDNAGVPVVEGDRRFWISQQNWGPVPQSMDGAVAQQQGYQAAFFEPINVQGNLSYVVDIR